MQARRESKRWDDLVHLTMTVSEFREMVEWLELIAWDDGCTKDMRKLLDEIDPPGADDD